MKKITSKSRSSWWDQVAKLYDGTYSEVESNLAKIYRRTQKEVIYDLMQVYNDISAGNNMSVNALYQYNRYYELINELNKKLRHLGQQEIKITEKSLIELYNKNVELLGTQLAFKPSFTDDQIIKAANSVWCQDGKLWSDRLWYDKQLMVNTMTQTLVDGVARGKSPDWLVKNVMHVMQSGYNNTQRIVITELAHIQNQAALDSYSQAGINQYKILHEPDACEICIELGRNTYDVNRAPVIPAHPRCRCCTLAIINGDVIDNV